MTALYVPGTTETDPSKTIMALQNVAGITSTNTANIATNTTNIATNTAAITALQTDTTAVTLQTVYAELTTFTTGTSAMTGGVDTIPQNTDGTQLVTVAITPRLSTSKLIIRVTMPATNSSAANIWTALFQDTTAAALTAEIIGVATGDTIVPVSFQYQMTSGTTSATTFKVRIGLLNGGAGTWAVNGTSSARRLGGAQRVTITVEEVKA